LIVVDISGSSAAQSQTGTAGERTPLPAGTLFHMQSAFGAPAASAPAFGAPSSTPAFGASAGFGAVSQNMRTHLLGLLHNPM